MTSRFMLGLLLLPLAAGCGRITDVGRAPAFKPVEDTYQMQAMYALPSATDAREGQAPAASLWNGGRESLLGDRRASTRGDIMTVVIEIDDRAEISNTTGRSRQGSDTMGIPQLFGLPQRLNEKLPEGAGMAEAISTGSTRAVPFT